MLVRNSIREEAGGVGNFTRRGRGVVIMSGARGGMGQGIFARKQLSTF